jgi:hypothetical protein
LSLALIAGLAPRWMLIVLWGLYLSFASVSGVFLGYQWDILLLEASLLAVFFAPPGVRPRLEHERPPSMVALWLLRWLLFRLMFLSGLVKLLSGDAAWRNLTALKYHYWTQPLPTLASYYAQQLPNAAHRVSAALMFGVELGIPLLIFGTRRMRLFAAGAFVFFQLLIAFTGNYGFFNLLTIVLCVTLLDDSALHSLVLRGWRDRIPVLRPEGVKTHRAVRIVSIALAALVVMASLAEMRLLRRRLPQQVEQILAVLQPFRSINSYGLFAIMTTTRPEIILEGSGDGREWRPYEFKWKPGRVDEPARFVAPHQPRVDWQMWFAALGSCRGNPWFLYFSTRLLEGSPDVLALLKSNPFPGELPTYLRSTVYEYEFSDWNDWSQRHVFWKREQKGPYCPVLKLTNGRLSVAHLN